MPQQPAEVDPLLVPGTERLSTPTQEIPPATPTAESTTDPLSSTPTPEDSPPSPRESSIQRFLSRHPALLGLVVMILVCVCLVIPFASNPLGHYAIEHCPNNESGVAILGSAFQFDFPATQKLSVRWFVVGCGDYALQPGDDLPPVNRPVDVYLDDTSNPAFSYDPANYPLLKTDEGTVVLDSPSFDLEHRPWVISGGQYLTPLDKYYFEAFVFVVEKATNKSVPITAFAAGDSEPRDYATTSDMVQTTNSFTHEAEGGPTTVEVKSYTTIIQVKHTTRARALTLSMFTINWVLTLSSLAVTMIMASRREVKDSVALLPITIILTIPVIRSLYIGSPPFGILFDVVGFFPQMLIVVVCIITVLFVSVQNRGSIHEGKVAV